MRKRIIAVVAIATCALVPLSTPAQAKTTKPTLAVSRSTVIQNDPVTLSGHSTARHVAIYRKLSGEPWRRIGTATTHHGKFRYTTRPAIARTNYYRTAVSKVSRVRSVRCTPLSRPGSVAVWFQDMTVDTKLTTRWAQAICSAAPGSTITMAEMFVYDNTPLVHQLMTALSNLHAYRDVHVRVLVQRTGYYSTAAEWASLLRHFSFAEVHYCWHACHSSNPSGHAHTKFTLLSKTVFGGPAVLESSANWSRSQLNEQRQSGVFVYDNRRLMSAYTAEWNSLVAHTPNDPSRWRSAGSGLWYSFDPHPVAQDPVVSDLASLHCEPGDSIGIADTTITRPGLIDQLNRLSDDGCSVRGLFDPTGSVAAGATFPVQTVTEHDKFIIVTAHLRDGSIQHEVIAGSENYGTLSMTASDQQLLIIRRPDVYSVYRWWFGHLWSLSTPVTPTVRAAAARRPSASIDDD